MNAELTKVGSLGIQLPGRCDHRGLGCKHGAEHREGQVKRMVLDRLQFARISFLKFQTAETRFSGSPVPGLHEVPGDVDSSDFRPLKGQRQRRGAVSAVSPDSRINAAISVKSPFSHNALLGFMRMSLYLGHVLVQTTERCLGHATYG